MERIDTTCGRDDILEQCHRLNQPVELITKNPFSRARSDPLRSESLLSLLCRMQKLDGKVCITRVRGGLLRSCSLVCYLRFLFLQLVDHNLPVILFRGGRAVQDSHLAVFHGEDSTVLRY
jgi:hypothetical protein